MEDSFENSIMGLGSPIAYLAAITPSDNASFALSSRVANLANERAIRATTLFIPKEIACLALGIALPLRILRALIAGTDKISGLAVTK